MDILLVDDEKTFRDAACLLVEDAGHYAEGASSREMALERLKEQQFDAVILDLNLGADNGLDVLLEIQKTRPAMPVVMLTAQASVGNAVEAMRRGALDFLEKPFRREQFLTVIARVQRFQQLDKKIESLEREVTETKSQQAEPIFDFSSPAMCEVMDVISRAADTPASILITGESGTGKSVVARAIHKMSGLADKPLITVSCPSLSKELLESELFGHVKGSFTGAIRDHWGKVKAAEGGTLFLDEIGDLPSEIQPKLLRLLQEREYERLGENVMRRANVRVIAATNRNLKERVAEGAFREDLFFRLNVIAVEMPPLRKRQGDLIRLSEHYLQFFANQCGRNVKGFSREALEAISTYSWPGNLRELRNSVERAAIMVRGEEVLPADLPVDCRAASGGDPASVSTDGIIEVGGLIPLERVEAMHIRLVVENTKNLAEAAQVLGIDQATLYRKRKKLGME